MKRRTKQWMMILGAVLVIALVIVYNHFAIQAQLNQHIPFKEAQAPAPDVSVVTVQGHTYQAAITGYGAAEPHYRLTLTAQVSGQVDQLNDQFATGQRVTKGTMLAHLEDSQYQASVRAAENDLSSAKLALLEEQRQGVQARKEWQSSGLTGQPSSPLVLRKPQLAAAQSAVADAKAALASARQDLAYTQITAPFDALIVSRDIAPGSYVQQGGEVATLYSTDRVEVTIPLSAANWRNLPTEAKLVAGNWPVVLHSVDGTEQWQGHVIRVAHHRDDNNRQRDVIAAIDRPLNQHPPLLPGTFLKADIAGKKVPQLWELPATALSQRGKIWYVDATDKLVSFFATPVFAKGNKIYVSAPDKLAGQPQKVVVHPLSSYLDAMSVTPVTEEQDDE